MAGESIVEQLGRKGVDIARIVDRIIDKPELTERITREILKVEKAKYVNKGALSPECRNVAIGQAIDSFDAFFGQIDNKARVVAFVKRQLKNTRKPVVKKAERFLRKYDPSSHSS